MNRKALKVRSNPSRPFRGKSSDGTRSGNETEIAAAPQAVGGVANNGTPGMHRGDCEAMDKAEQTGGARKWLTAHFLLCLIMVGCSVLLSACGGGSGTTPSTTPTVSFTQVPPSPFPIGGQAQLIATVLNDPSQMGVNWTVSCQAAKCGTFSPAHTVSGAPTFYTAPNAVPAGNTVNITATSVFAPSQQVTVSITLTVATQSVGISFTQSPPGTVNTNSTTMVTATVSNDPTNAGVEWQVTCAGGSTCGTITPSMSSSGEAVTYAAPATPPGNGGLVNIIAIAVADPSVMVTATTQVISTALQVSFNPAPPITLGVGLTTPITAVVLNDPTGEGVNWTVTCGSADCGSFMPTTTLSGMATTYTAPAMTPAGNNVTIVATSVAEPTVNATATIQITSMANQLGLLNGQYAISFSGADTNGFYGATGSFIADGMGNITSGEEDFYDPTIYMVSPFPVVGTYTIGMDGRGTMYLCNYVNVGASGSIGCPMNMGYMHEQILDFTVVNSSHTLVIEFDYSATSHGSIDLQTPADFTLAGVTGGYSFVFPGADINTNAPAALGGVFSANGAGDFTTGTVDINDNGTVTLGSGNNFVGTYNSLPGVDSFGRATACFPSDCSLYTFSFYIVNTGQLNFVETDASFVSAGSAFSQGDSLSGPYGFTGAGFAGTEVRVEGGLFTADSGNLSGGVIDVNDAGNTTLDTSFTGTYSIASTGRGSMTLTGKPGGIGMFEIYATKSNGVLLFETDSGSVSTGAALAQDTTISASTFDGMYAAYYQSYPTTISPTDVVGQIISDGVSKLTGTADVNQGFSTQMGSQTTGWTVMGTYADGSKGRFTGDLDLTLNTMSPVNAQEVFYILNASTVLTLETDTSPGTGLLQLQNLTIPAVK